MKTEKHTKPAAKARRSSLKNIQRLFFRTQFILILTLALFLGAAGTLINIHFETEKRDQNLQNVAEAIAHSPILTENDLTDEATARILLGYLDSLLESLDDIDVISVVSRDQRRIYHSNHDWIGTVYKGTLPQFIPQVKEYYTADETGPSGTQRRAYAAIYDEDGHYIGFVMAIMLMKNIQTEMRQTFITFTLITLAAIFMELLISAEFSGKIKKSLLGYEPDVFTTMFKMRDNILESLAEGIIAIDTAGIVQFANQSAAQMLNTLEPGLGDTIVGQSIRSIGDGSLLLRTLESGEKEFSHNPGGNANILIDSIPIRKDGEIVGAVGILHNRAEYTKLMEDLTGTRYLVDSMRANNHDFTNKLHVILGLIQMENYEEAMSYIQNITMVQRAAISNIMHAVDEPAVAALLIGKTARASELNVRFILREGCHYAASDLPLPSEVLITIIGNLIDNAFDAMNVDFDDFNRQKELLFGIYSRPGAVLITVDDTGTGIAPENLERIFENGYSSKGEGRGTGLYQVKSIVENLGGKITVESQLGIGTSFSVSFTKSNKTGG